MSDISAERRLELIRMVREEQARNHMTIRRRESLLYGNQYIPTDASRPEELPSVAGMGIKIRILAALVLFLTFLILDKNGITFLEMNTDTVFGYITANADTFDFIEDFMEK